MLVWTDPHWLRVAQDWIDGELGRLGLVAAGAIEQSHVTPWSTAMRVPVSGGDLWFKANMPALAFEAAVIDILGRRRPGCVPELRAIDRDRGWVLMADAGVPLRDVVTRERDLRRWLDVLPRYAQLQLDATGDVDELLRSGCLTVSSTTFRPSTNACSRRRAAWRPMSVPDSTASALE